MTSADIRGQGGAHGEFGRVLQYKSLVRVFPPSWSHRLRPHPSQPKRVAHKRGWRGGDELSSARMARISSQLMPTDDLPIGWETSWEDMVGSPRFEESLETCGCLLEDVRTSVAPVQKSLEPKVMQQLVARREKRRLYELQTVLLERKRIIGVTEDTKTGDTIDWAAKMKQENEVGVAALQPSSTSIGTTATSTTLTLEPSRTRTRYDI